MYLSFHFDYIAIINKKTKCLDIRHPSEGCEVNICGMILSFLDPPLYIFSQSKNSYCVLRRKDIFSHYNSDSISKPWIYDIDQRFLTFLFLNRDLKI